MSLERLISDLKNGLGMVRVNAAAELGKLKDKGAEQALIEALGDGNMAVRNNAAFSLGELRSHDAVPRLIAMFSDPEERVRKSAVKALGMIGAQRCDRAPHAAARQRSIGRCEEERDPQPGTDRRIESHAGSRVFYIQPGCDARGNGEAGA